MLYMWVLTVHHCIDVVVDHAAHCVHVSVAARGLLKLQVIVSIALHLVDIILPPVRERSNSS